MAGTTKKRKKPTSSAKKRVVNKKNPKLDKKAIKIIIAAVAAVIAIVAIALAGNGKKVEKGKITLTGSIAEGVDVSSHNGKIDWKKVKNSADFAIIRVGARGYTKGEINPDKRAAYNLKHANKNGVAAGVYFYSQAIDEKEAREEAEFVIENIRKYDISLPVFIDYEYPTKNGQHTGRMFNAKHSKKERTAVLNAFCDTVREAGYTPGIYASSYIYKTEIVNRLIPDDVYIWVAEYNKEVSYEGFYDIWQYTESGNCDGIDSKNVDLNYFYIDKRE